MFSRIHTLIQMINNLTNSTKSPVPDKEDSALQHGLWSRFRHDDSSSFSGTSMCFGLLLVIIASLFRVM